MSSIGFVKVFAFSQRVALYGPWLLNLMAAQGLKGEGATGWHCTSGSRAAAGELPAGLWQLTSDLFGLPGASRQLSWTSACRELAWQVVPLKPARNWWCCPLVC